MGGSSPYNGRYMLAVLAVRTDPADPLAGLAVAERDEPRPPEGWELVKVVAASLNHHDLFTLQGIGVDPGRLPIVLGCDASGVTQHGREVIIHAVISSAPGGDEPRPYGAATKSGIPRSRSG